LKKNSTKKSDDYELRKEYDLTKLPIVPKGRFDPKHGIGNKMSDERASVETKEAISFIEAQL
jgi:hypothetical protein